MSIEKIFPFEYSTQSISTRPACPVCGKGTLTGWLTNTQKTKVEYVTVCSNAECLATVYLDESWNITYFIVGKKK